MSDINRTNTEAAELRSNNFVSSINFGNEIKSEKRSFILTNQSNSMYFFIRKILFKLKKIQRGNTRIKENVLQS